MPPQAAVLSVDLGRTSYAACWDLQRRTHDLRSRGIIPDVLLLTEHDHVYTLGTGGDANHLLGRLAMQRGQGFLFVGWYDERVRSIMNRF